MAVLAKVCGIMNLLPQRYRNTDKFAVGKRESSFFNRKHVKVPMPY